MCFAISTFYGKRAKTAEKRILCFKVLKVRKRAGKDYHLSPYMSTEWPMGKINVSKMKITLPHGKTNMWSGNIRYEINQGLHVFKTFKDAKDYFSSDENLKVFRAYIPKGARYWENNTQFVSNQLKVTTPAKKK